MSTVEVGVYGIFDAETDECLYVGQSVRIPERWQEHLKRLRNGSHKREDFVEWFKKRGQEESALTFKILEETDESDESLNRAEIRWFNELKPQFYGKKPSMNERWEHSEETRRKISEARREDGELFIFEIERFCPTCDKKFFSKYPDTTYCSVDCINYDQVQDRRNATLGLTPRHSLDGERIEGMYREGFSMLKIGEVFDVSYNTIRTVLLEREVPFRGHGEMPKSFTPLPPKKRECSVCGEMFILRKRNSEVQTCSIACRGVLHSSNLRGVSIEEVLKLREA